MRRLRFLTSPGSLSDGEGARIALDEDEGHHLHAALRGREGDEIHLFDGSGVEWRARIVAGGPRETVAVLVAPVLDPVEPLVRIVVLQAVSRDEPFEAAVDQLTALGVAAIVPLQVARGKSPRGPDAKRLARWRRIAREAAKLSWRRVVPAILDPAGIEDLSRVSSEGAARWLLDPDARDGSLVAALAGPPRQEVVIAAGPEGGFSESEIARFVDHRFLSVGLGPRVLRTEHAAASAVTLVLAAWADLR